MNEISPDLAAALAANEEQLRALKDQLLIVLVNRLGGKIEIPALEVNDTGQMMLDMTLTDGVFTFETYKKS